MSTTFRRVGDCNLSASFLLASSLVFTACHRAPETAQVTAPEASNCATTPADQLFVAQPFTASRLFTAEIEGPSVDADGNIYAVAFGKPEVVGRVAPSGDATAFVTIPDGGAANGSVISKAGDLYLADWISHRIWRVAKGDNNLELWVENRTMNQPNDLAILRDGTLYVSDPDWEHVDHGKLWRSDGKGHLVEVASGLGTPNGIEVALDESFLITGESREKRVWKFPILPDKSLGKAELWLDLADYEGDVDGVRVDTSGNFYLTINGGHRVLLVDPQGKVLRDIATPGIDPSNLAFGGVDGCTLYLTDLQNGQLAAMRVDQPGRSTRW